MVTCVKAPVAAVVAALLLAIAIADVSANRLSISNARFRVVWRSLEVESAAGTVRCPVTMEGSLHSSTISKIAGALIGYISRATAFTAACTGGLGSIDPTELPYHDVYGGFRGSLPIMSWIKRALRHFEFWASIGGLACTVTTTAEHPLVALYEFNAEGMLEDVTLEEEATIPLRGSFLCEISGNARFKGRGKVTLLGNTTKIRVSLI